MNKKLKNKFFCYMPWFAMTLRADGSIKPCCQYSNKNLDKISSGGVDFLNSKNFINLRKKFLEGGKPEECRSCWERECQMGESRRLWFIEKFLKFVPENYNFKEKVKKSELIQVDIKFSNLCNLKCRMCGAGNSDGWIDDEKKINKKTEYKRIKQSDALRLNINNFQDLKFLCEKLTSVKRIDFKGGEPFLANEHNKILEYLIEKNLNHQIGLVYTTNGTVLNQETLNLLSNFKKVTIVFSVEAVGDLYGYIRGGKYTINDFVNNVKEYDKLPNISIGYNVAINAYNLLGLHGLYEFLKNLNLRNHSIKGAFNCIVNRPEYLSPFVLPRDLRFLAHENLKENPAFNKKFINNLISFPDDHKMFKVFKDFTDDLDELRGENILDVVPEFKKYWS